MTPAPEQLANALRNLAMDCVEHAGSGHPGMPMGMADVATALWHRHLRHHPGNPDWLNRDRFVLSNGHGSALLYALLHLTGYDLPATELRRFRRLGSRTPGHPERGCTPGVETTTGPLGQGLANAVGMALAEKLLALEFNRDGLPVVDHRTYAFAGDGCLMEGVSHEACSLAGTWKLGKLVVFWDDNGISIDGDVRGWFTDRTPQRFAAYGWRVIEDVDGHDLAALERAIQAAHVDGDAPTLICCRTTIGRGSPGKAGSADVHGAPLGAVEHERTRRALDWTHAAFEVPADIGAAWNATARGAAAEAAWNELFVRYAEKHPKLASELTRRTDGRLPADFEASTRALIANNATVGRPLATRKASQDAVGFLAPGLPELLGGSADLTGSNLTDWPLSVSTQGNAAGNYLHYGVREFGMAAVMNGIALHGGHRPFGGTFLVFSDYARNAMRMAALMKISVIYVLTHDSIGLGADGPTHQPVEHLAGLRQIPNMDVWRPCDAVETAQAWAAALAHTRTPTCIVLSRQPLPPQARTAQELSLVGRGGYVLRHESTARADVVLIATGSEVVLAMAAARRLAEMGVQARVVSMPSTHVFERQSAAYRAAVLPAGVPRVAVEAAAPDGWFKYVGLQGRVVGMKSFGESGDAEALYRHFGITSDAVVEAAAAVICTPAPAWSERHPEGVQ